MIFVYILIGILVAIAFAVTGVFGVIAYELRRDRIGKAIKDALEGLRL